MSIIVYAKFKRLKSFLKSFNKYSGFKQILVFSRFGAEGVWSASNRAEWKILIIISYLRNLLNGVAMTTEVIKLAYFIEILMNCVIQQHFCVKLADHSSSVGIVYSIYFRCCIVL